MRHFQGNLPDRWSGVEIVIAGMEDAQVRYQRPQARRMQPEGFMVRRTRKMKKPKRAMATEENTTAVQPKTRLRLKAPTSLETTQ